VADLCQAHVLALDFLAENARSAAYNLGNNQGFSVREIIDTAERVSGKRIPVSIGSRRAGDPAVLVADSRKAIAELGWRPQYQALDTIVGHAWNWEQKLARQAANDSEGSA